MAEVSNYVIGFLVLLRDADPRYLITPTQYVGNCCLMCLFLFLDAVRLMFVLSYPNVHDLVLLWTNIFWQNLPVMSRPSCADLTLWRFWYVVATIVSFKPFLRFDQFDSDRYTSWYLIPASSFARVKRMFKLHELLSSICDKLCSNIFIFKLMSDSCWN
jgi:hypothetical protein